MPTLAHQLGYLLLLALPIACASWTVTHEEVFREPREYCKDKSQTCKPLVQRNSSTCLPANTAFRIT